MAELRIQIKDEMAQKVIAAFGTLAGKTIALQGKYEGGGCVSRVTFPEQGDMAAAAYARQVVVIWSRALAQHAEDVLADAAYTTTIASIERDDATIDEETFS